MKIKTSLGFEILVPDSDGDVLIKILPDLLAHEKKILTQRHDAEMAQLYREHAKILDDFISHGYNPDYLKLEVETK